MSEGHSDVVGSENFLQNVMDADGDFTGERSMARSVDLGQNNPERKHRMMPRLEWDDNPYEITNTKSRLHDDTYSNVHDTPHSRV